MRQVLRIFYGTWALFSAKTSISPANRELAELAAGQPISMPGMRRRGTRAASPPDPARRPPSTSPPT